MKKLNSMLVTLLVCALPTLSQSRSPKDELLNSDRQFAQDTRDQKLEGWMKWFSTSTTLGGLPEGVIGEKQLRAYYSGLFDERYILLSWNPTSAEVLPDGKTGYTVGRYEFHQRGANGGEVKKTGTYLTVWKLQEGGWKVVSDFNAPDPAP